MHIGILETGLPPEELDQFDSYPLMVEKLLNSPKAMSEATAAPTKPVFSYQHFALLSDEFPDSASQCDGWVITGSKYGVYDELPWITRLEQLVRAIYAAKRPLLGICFGHQIIAKALGGVAAKSEKGWGLGLHTYQLNDQSPQWIQANDRQFTLNVVHQDQVIIPPGSATTIASSEFCEHAALIYGNQILSFQGHPEFSLSYEAALIQFRQGSVFPDEIAEPALAGLEQKEARHDGALIAAWANYFFTKINPHQSTNR